MQTLLLIDGNAIMYRAFFAIPTTFKTTDGVPTNAVYGFVTMLHKAISDFKPEYVIICFDTPKPTFRKKMFENYQAQRAPIADDFKIQIPLIKKMLDLAGITRTEKEGFEADDIIGTMVERYKKNHRILILTGDKDIMQLIDDNVFVMSPQTGISAIKLYNRDEVKTKLGCTPEEIPDLKALMGDSSDNYSGAKGIGPKTACSLLEQFKTVENLLKHTDEIESERIRTIIEGHREQILMSKSLATIMRDVPVSISIENAEFTGFKEELKAFLDKLEMHSLVERLFLGQNHPPKPAKEKKEKPKPQTEIQQDKLFS